MSEGRISKIKDSSHLIKLLQEYEREYGTKNVYFINSENKIQLDCEIVEYYNDLRLHFNKDSKDVMFLAIRETKKKASAIDFNTLNHCKRNIEETIFKYPNVVVISNRFYFGTSNSAIATIFNPTSLARITPHTNGIKSLQMRASSREIIEVSDNEIIGYMYYDIPNITVRAYTGFWETVLESKDINLLDTDFYNPFISWS